MEEKKQLTTEERRLQRIAQLKARLQKEEARLADSERKKRTGQLVSWGVMVEEIFKSADEAGRQRLIESAKKTSQGQELAAGFGRIFKARRGVSLMSAIDFASMTNANNENDNSVFLNFSNHSKISDTVFPKAS